MKNFVFASVAALGLLSLAACNDSQSTTGGNSSGASQPAAASSGTTAAPATTTEPASGASQPAASSATPQAAPATTSSAPNAAPATTTAPASGATTNSGNVMPTNDNTSSATIETRPDVPQSGSGGASQANPAGDDATPTAPTPQPGGSTTTAQ